MTAGMTPVRKSLDSPLQTETRPKSQAAGRPEKEEAAAVTSVITLFIHGSSETTAEKPAAEKVHRPSAFRPHQSAELPASEAPTGRIRTEASMRNSED